LVVFSYLPGGTLFWDVPTDAVLERHTVAANGSRLVSDFTA